MIIPHTTATRIVAAVAAALALLPCLERATARDDLGLHLFWSEPVPGDPFDDRAAVPPLPLRFARAVARPLRIALVTRRGNHSSRRRQHGSTMLAQAAGSRLLSLPVPTKPAIVSLYQDRTLRNGDAVMLADGIHIFHGDVSGQHRQRDFVRLQQAASLGWQLRQTLNDLDRNPPTRWTSLVSTPG